MNIYRRSMPNGGLTEEGEKEFCCVGGHLLYCREILKCIIVKNQYE